MLSNPSLKVFIRTRVFFPSIPLSLLYHHLLVLHYRPNKLIAFTAVVTGILLLIIGIHIPFQSFPIEYPLDIDILPEIQKLKNGLEPSVQPITVFNYSYLKEAESTCSGVRPNVLFIVKSARYHLQRRKIIRQTWGSKTRLPDVVIRIVFLIGNKLGENNLDKILDKEDEVYNDLVQADFIDSYGNNALKTLSGFKWAVQHCSHAQFIVFSDDDMYISPLNILRFINNPHQYPDGSSSNSLLDSNQSLYAGNKWFAFKIFLKVQFCNSRKNVVIHAGYYLDHLYNSGKSYQLVLRQ